VRGRSRPWGRVAGAVRRRVRDRLGTHPRVTVLVLLPEGSGPPDACIASVRASVDVIADAVIVPQGTALAEVLAAVPTDLVAFAAADDEIPPDALARMVSALTGTVDLVAGRRRALRAGRDLGTPPPGSAVDLALGGKLVRRVFLADVAPPYDGPERQEVTTATLVAAARRVAAVDEVVLVEHDRDVALPIHEQRRFRTDLVAARVDALRYVLHDLLTPADRHGWREDALIHLLPGLCRDAVGGGPSFHAVVQAFALDLVAGGVRNDTVPVEARVAAWVAAHGTYTDLALTEDHLAANPHGLPVEGGVVPAPDGLTIDVLEDYRRVGAADRPLRSRVLDLEPLSGGRARLRGDAFVHTESGADLPTVSIAAEGAAPREVPVERWYDDRANLWAARAWEDRRDSGFEGTAALPTRGASWRVRVELGGQVAEHRARLLPTATGIDTAALEPAGLRLSGTGAPVRLRLAGPRGTTPWSDATTVGGRFDAVLALVTSAPWGQTRLPGGRYTLEVQGSRGRADDLGWSPALLARPPDLVDQRAALRLAAKGTVVVDAPLDDQQQSAFGQQALVSAYAAAPGAGMRDTVLLESFHGRAVADNPAAIARALAARDPRLDLVWVVDDPSVEVPEGMRAVARRTPAWFEALAGAHAYVGNAAAPPWFAKKPGQIHVQTWHGTPLKRIGEDRGPGDLSTWRHRRSLARQAAGWDGFVSPSPFCSEIFRSAFSYEGPMLEIGYPRNDVLLSARAPEVRAETRRRLGVADDQRVVLYAPTWREYLGVRDSKPLFLDPTRLVAAMPDAVVLVRGHYNASRQADLRPGRGQVVDVTRYPDIADLYLAADALVTDYSSVMFDFALTDKPIVLLTPDLDRYRDVERGFYFDIEAASPGPMVTSTDEVVEALQADDAHAAARAGIRERFCPWDDGHAADRAVDHLLARW
jgi:CDP-glycerol glycerophosphotransferase (TagB/SpsB family)